MGIKIKSIIFLLVTSIPQIYSQCNVLDLDGNVLDTIHIGSESEPILENSTLGAHLWTGRLSSPMEVMTYPGLEVLDIALVSGELNILAGSNFSNQVDTTRETFYFNHMIFRCLATNQPVFVSVIVLFDPANNRVPELNIENLTLSLKLPWETSTPINYNQPIIATDQDYLVGSTLNVTINDPRFRIEFDEGTGNIELYSVDSMLKHTNVTITVSDGLNFIRLPVNIFTNLLPPKFDKEYYLVNRRPSDLFITDFSAADPDADPNVRIEYRVTDPNIRLNGNAAYFITTRPRPDQLPYMFEITATEVPSNPIEQTKALVILSYEERVFGAEYYNLNYLYLPIYRGQVLVDDFITDIYPIELPDEFLSMSLYSLKFEIDLYTMDDVYSWFGSHYYFTSVEYGAQHTSVLIHFNDQYVTTEATTTEREECEICPTVPSCYYPDNLCDCSTLEKENNNHTNATSTLK